MLPKKLSQIAQFYQQRFGFKSQLLANPPHPNTQLIITIPCFNEPNLIPTLQSLLECYPTTCQVEVIVGINAGEHVAPEIHVQNQKTKLEFIQWNTSIKNPASHLRFQVIDVNDLPAKHAGAGLARKVVMDEALYRFAQLDYDGGIVCLDADCLVSPNYLTELERAFVKNTHTQSAALYFEHPYQHEKNQQLKAGISNYELHLRYYIQGLRYAQFPYALHTVGSSMAVRASTYALTGGMNRRKAGEDFYFMHKMMPQGDAIEINSTCVFPSCRMSDRVPFGTGRAQNEWMKNEEKVFYTYHPQIFTELKHFLEALPMWYQNEHTETLTLPPAMQTFL
ncbi:MAG: glycosyltransferase, partial [Flammeovirgaceae bacterium]